MTFTARIRGLPHNPAIVEINTRSGPSTGYNRPFKAQVGLSDLPVLDVKPDEAGTDFEGKRYQWFQLEFPDGQRAWVRDDLLAVTGDGSAFGYENIEEDTFAFTLQRHYEEPQTPPTPVETSTTQTAIRVVETPDPPADDDPLDEAERIRLAAFNITGAFEGDGYGAFQNYDAGIVSYGRFQFTLAGSSLFKVIQKFTERARTPIAGELRASYFDRIRNHDPALRQDERLRQLLRDASNDPIMQAAQDETATELYWNVVQDLSIRPRGIKTPLGQALIFDMGVNFGPRHGFLGAAEKQIGVPPRSRLIENGAREENLIAALAKLRKRSHDMQAERDNLPGLRVRGDFWVRLVERGDWQLEGDSEGLIEVTPDKRIRVRNFKTH